MSIKKIIAIGLITASVGFLVIKSKIEKFTKQFDSVKILPISLSDLQFIWNDGKPLLRFKINLEFTNQLAEKVTLNGLIFKLQRIIIYDTYGKAIGVSTPNIGNITIPPHGKYVLPNVPFEVDVKALAINLLNYKNITKDSFKFESIISVLGAEYKIKQ